MTDKQVIVDGIDVSGCVSFDKNNGYNICCYDDTREDKIPFANFCVENKDCYYKQLQREKQNSQEAMDASIREFNRAEELKTLLKRKEQECEKYKQTLAKIKMAS